MLQGGVNVVIQGLSVEGLPEAFGPLGDVDIETDRAVIWGLPASSIPAGATQQSDLPLEIYMEGNIVFRQGDRTVYADRMFYDVRRQIGIILNAELLTPRAAIDGLPVRRPGAAPGRRDAAARPARTSSPRTAWSPPAGSKNPATPSPPRRSPSRTSSGRPSIRSPACRSSIRSPASRSSTTNMLVESQSNVALRRRRARVLLADARHRPRKAELLHRQRPRPQRFDLRLPDAVRARRVPVVRHRSRPQGVEWDLNLDYLSERGLGFGTGVEYARDSFFGIAGPTTGRVDAWGINDDGHDNLGLGRRDIVPEEEFRGRAFWNHRQHLVGGLLDDWTVQGEVGWHQRPHVPRSSTTRSEWDDNKDQLTGVRLKRTFDNQSLSIEANGRINDFFTQTQWLPRLDHYWLGEPLFDDQLTWFEHSSAAYANIGIATHADEPARCSPVRTLLPWEDDSAGNPITGEGERFVTRQEIDWPLDLAPFKVVPFALGELAHWGEDIDGDDIQRAYVPHRRAGQHSVLGRRSDDPRPAVQPQRPRAQSGVRRRSLVRRRQPQTSTSCRSTTSSTTTRSRNSAAGCSSRRSAASWPARYYIPGAPSFIDPKFDPRFYALRSGLQGWVTSPSTEIADDLAAVRMGMRHRLQTKRGPLGDERIIDWLTFDSNATWFPDDDRDNFGADFGLIDYDLRWHLGDRFSILSDGYADTFGDGLRTASIGVLLNRPTRGNAYLGFRTIGGLIRGQRRHRPRSTTA